MGHDDGEWIHGEGPAESEDADAGPDAGSDGDWLGREWPAGRAPLADRERRGDWGIPAFSIRVAAVVAALAAAAGAAAGLLVVRGMPTAAVAAPSAGSTGLPKPSGLPAPSGLPGGGSGLVRIMLTGRVLAVSDRSITIDSNGASVTAAITSSTKVTGKAGGIGGVRVGDEVSAQITGSSGAGADGAGSGEAGSGEAGGELTATVIQDPAG